MKRGFLTIALFAACISMSGCVTYGVVETARGRVDSRRTMVPRAEDIQPLSASADGTSIYVCFRALHGSDEIVYTAVAPDPEGPAKNYLPSVGPFQIRSLKLGCHLRGQSIDLHSDLSEQWPSLDSARGIYPMLRQGLIYPSYRFIYRSGKYAEVEISIFEAEQFNPRINARPFFYLAIPFTLVADVVATPIWLIWMSVCGSCK
jgi:hypothetical protein